MTDQDVLSTFQGTLIGGDVANIVKALLGGDEPKKPKPTSTEVQIRQDVREAAMKADGAIRIGEHIMDGLVELDAHRRELAGADQTLNVLLAEVEAETVGQVKKIQRNLYGQWELP